MKHFMAAFMLALMAGGTALAEEAGDSAALKARSVYLSGDNNRAMALALPLAEAGVPRAQMLVGLMYERGHGVAADPVKAMEWFQKAAAQGFPQALHNVAYSHESARGVLQWTSPWRLSCTCGRRRWISDHR